MTPVQTTPRPAVRLRNAVLAGLIALCVPLLLTIGAVRLVMTPLFLQLEYHRPGFPDDYYGFTLEDRLRLAPLAVAYLVNREPIAFLGDQRFPDGTPLYNERELRHMVDVQQVTTAAFALGLGALAAAGLVGLWLWRAGERRRLASALNAGAVLTLGIIAAIVIGAALAWDQFFTLFHELFFTDGTWYFPYSDTLIRLFPEAFWFDAAVIIGGLTIAGAAGVWLVARQIGSRARAHFAQNARPAVG